MIPEKFPLSPARIQTHWKKYIDARPGGRTDGRALFYMVLTQSNTHNKSSPSDPPPGRINFTDYYVIFRVAAISWKLKV